MPPNTPYPTQPSQTPSPSYPLMGKSQKQKGFNWLLVPLGLFVVLFLGAAGAAVSINSQKEDYKNNVDQKVAAAVETAEQRVSDEKEKEFLEREKNPYRKYAGPATFGSLEIVYPKTWSAAIDEGAGNIPVDGSFHPNFVPSKGSKTALALRVQILEQPYNQLLSRFESDTKKGTVRISPFRAAKVPSVLGARIDGEVANGFKGSMVMFPLRDKTIQITTLSQQFVGDFDNIILPNILFIP